MRGFQCTVYFGTSAGDLIPASHGACWGMLQGETRERIIYIGSFDEPETQKYQPLLLGLVNKITLCKLYEHKINKRLIQFQMLSTYDQSLVLLNFIRNLWHQPIPHYTSNFFIALEKSEEYYSDPLERMTWANIRAVQAGVMLYGNVGHSNVHKNLKVKSTKQLLDYKGNSTQAFLTI